MNSLENANTLYRHAKEVFADAAVNLWNCQSNSKEIEKFISANEENNRDLTEKFAQETLNNIQKCDFKVLGIPWNKEDD